MPDAGLGTDVIAGFPGESEADFAAGKELLRGAPFTYFHVFPYSRRSGTTAAKAGDPVPRRGRRGARPPAAPTGGRRSDAPSPLRFVGRSLPVLVEATRDRESGRLAGYSRNYVRVLVDGPNSLVNRELAVHLTGTRGDRALGNAAADHGGATRAG